MYEENNNLGYTGNTNMNGNANAGNSAYTGGYSSYEISSNSPKAPQKKKSSGFFKKMLPQILKQLLMFD